MNILIESQNDESTKAGIVCIDNLQLADASLNLINSTSETPSPYSVEVRDALRFLGEEQGSLRVACYSSEVFSEASPVASLVQAAKRIGAELIVTNSTLDLVSLLNAAPCSVLVARSHQARRQTTAALLITDHSPLAIRSIRNFHLLNLQGLDRIRILTSVHRLLSEEKKRGDTKNGGNTTSHFTFHTIQELNRSLIDQFAQHGYDVDARVIGTPLDEVVGQAVRRMDASLIVVAVKIENLSSEEKSLIPALLADTNCPILFLHP